MENSGVGESVGSDGRPDPWSKEGTVLLLLYLSFFCACLEKQGKVHPEGTLGS